MNDVGPLKAVAVFLGAMFVFIVGTTAALSGLAYALIKLTGHP